MKIKTEYGLEQFHGVRRVEKYIWLEVITTLSKISVTLDHRFLTNKGMISSSSLSIGDYIVGGGEVKKKYIKTGRKYFYDILNTESNTYSANGMCVSNCVWLSSKATLIDSRVIEAIKPIDPVREDKGLKLFVDSVHGKSLVMAVDVSEGVGDDAHVIQIFDVETLEQVGIYSNNTDNQHMLASKLIEIITLLFNEGAIEIYYGIENNGVGNGVLRLIEAADNSFLDRATMISSTDQNGVIRKNGITMSSRTKSEGCAQLKQLIENGRMKINDAGTKVEMQFFIKSGPSFKAERGAKDDKMMALVILSLMLIELTVYEDSVNEAVYEMDEDDESWGFVF